MSVREADSIHRQRILHLLREIDRDEGINTHGSPAAQQIALALMDLLDRSDHPLARTLVKPKQHNGEVAVRRVEDYIHKHLDESLRIEDLAAVAGVSVRTLFRVFRHRRACSPMDFAQQARLERVRADLKEGRRDLKVTNAATDWGFSHPGRFSKLYKDEYGETPSETLRVRGSERFWKHRDRM